MIIISLRFTQLTAHTREEGNAITYVSADEQLAFTILKSSFDNKSVISVNFEIHLSLDSSR
jgi:hypothetical protein